MVSGTTPGSTGGDPPCASNRSPTVKNVDLVPKPSPEVVPETATTPPLRRGRHTAAPGTGPRGGSRPSPPTSKTCTKQARTPSRRRRTKSVKQTRQMARPEANWSEPISKPSSVRLSSQAKRAASENQRCKGVTSAVADAGTRHAPESFNAFCDQARASGRGDRNPKRFALPRPPPPAPAAASVPPETNGALTTRNHASGHLIKNTSRGAPGMSMTPSSNPGGWLIAWAHLGRPPWHARQRTHAAPHKQQLHPEHRNGLYHY